MNCFVLRYEKTFMKFYVGPKLVRIHGPNGASDSVNKVVSKVEARAFWESLTDRGWERVPLSEAPAGDWWFM